jgi:hypothetical protein
VGATVPEGATTAVRRSERRRLVTAVSVLAVATLVLIAVVLLMYANASMKASDVSRSKPAAVADVAAQQAPPPAQEIADDIPVKAAIGPDTIIPAGDLTAELAAAETARLPKQMESADRAPSEAEMRAEIEAAVEAALAAQMEQYDEGGMVYVPPAAGGFPVFGIDDEHQGEDAPDDPDEPDEPDAPDAPDEPDEPDEPARPSGLGEGAKDVGKVVPVDPSALLKIAFSNVVVTKDAELVARTPQVVSYATALEDDSVAALYEKWATGKGYKYQIAGQTMLINSDASPLRTISYSPNSAITAELPHLVSVVFRERFAKPLEIGDLAPFGVPVFPGAVAITITAQAIIYEVGKPVDDVAPFYAKLFGGKEGVMVTRNRVMGADQLVIFSQRPSDAFMTITVMSSMTEGNATQIVVVSSEMMGAMGPEGSVYNL